MSLLLLSYEWKPQQGLWIKVEGYIAALLYKTTGSSKFKCDSERILCRIKEELRRMVVVTEIVTRY